MTYLSLLLMTSSGHAHLDRHRYDIVACRKVGKSFWGRFLYGVYGKGNDFEVIVMVTRTHQEMR